MHLEGPRRALFAAAGTGRFGSSALRACGLLRASRRHQADCRPRSPDGRGRAAAPSRRDARASASRRAVRPRQAQAATRVPAARRRDRRPQRRKHRRDPGTAPALSAAGHCFLRRLCAGSARSWLGDRRARTSAGRRGRRHDRARSRRRLDRRPAGLRRRAPVPGDLRLRGAGHNKHRPHQGPSQLRPRGGGLRARTGEGGRDCDPPFGRRATGGSRSPLHGARACVRPSTRDGASGWGSCCTARARVSRASVWI